MLMLLLLAVEVQVSDVKEAGKIITEPPTISRRDREKGAEQNVLVVVGPI